MKRQIEIEDTLQETVETLIEEIKDLLIEYLKENKPDELPCLQNDLDCGGEISQMIDSSVPVYTSEINDLFYLYGNEFEQAFDDAGIGEKNSDWPNGWKAAAIYCYLEQKVNDWYSKEAQDIFDDWKE